MDEKNIALKVPYCQNITGLGAMELPYTFQNSQSTVKLTQPA